MLKAFEFCLPTAAKAVPADPDWIHEVKYDGYSLRVERQGKSVRLITRNGHDWTKRFPWIVQAAPKNREQQFVIEVSCGCSASTASRTSRAAFAQARRRGVALSARVANCALCCETAPSTLKERRLPKKKQVVRREWTTSDVKELKAHSKARTPVMKITKMTKRTEGSLRQKALYLGIGLGHQR